MAKVYRAPIDPPAIEGIRDFKRYDADCKAYIERLSAMARERAGTVAAGSLVGKVVRFQIADGYAQYVVWSERPLQLVHIDVMDGYSISAAHARGLKLADIRAMVASDDVWQGIMDEHDEFYRNLPLGSIVHYDNGFGKFVRAERIEGERGKRLRPIALVGNWDPAMDLPRRNVDGSITLHYYPEKIAKGEPFEPNSGSIWEAMDDKRRAWTMRGLAPEGKARLNEIGLARLAEKRYQTPFDPVTAEAIDLTPPPPPEGEARALAAYVQRLRQIEAAIGSTPRTLDEARERYAAVRALVVPDYELPEPVL